ncbi:MAG: hypothetical protein JWQ98_3148 [Chlorobi bacterium]|nr:hypothetical protein [Chlorobiota bacterium]
MVVMSLLGSPEATAQQSRVSKPLTVWVDSASFNVCDGSKVFLLGVWTSPISVQDSLVSMDIYLAWDISKLDFESLAVTSSGTIGSQFDSKSVDKLPEGGLHVQLGNLSLRPVYGSGKPLFYIKGSVIAPDTVKSPDGWVDVTSIDPYGKTNFEPIDYQPGYVRVHRDTTPDYTGMLSVMGGSFDTMRVDTVTLTTTNLKGHRVNEVTFALKADTSNYYFVDTIQRGTIADSSGWTTKNLVVTPDSIGGRFVAQSSLTVDGPLLNIVIRRKNEKGFTSELRVSRFAVNAQSCLGKLTFQNGQIMADPIPVDSGTVGVEEERRGERAVSIWPDDQRGSITVRAGGMEIEEVIIYDAMGQMLPIRQMDRIDASSLRVRLAGQPSNGTYFVILRGRNEIVYKQFTFIK